MREKHGKVNGKCNVSPPIYETPHILISCSLLSYTVAGEQIIMRHHYTVSVSDPITSSSQRFPRVQMSLLRAS